MNEQKLNKTEKLREIKNQVFNLEDSALADIRRRTEMFPVIGEGNHNADIIFIGEAPGKEEARYGRPFCGRAGNFLDELLKSIKLGRDSIYITNILKDRPPQNRDPQPQEIALYSPFLDKQIEIIEPKVIATLGRFSMNYIFNLYSIEGDKSITKSHGKKYSVENSSNNSIDVIPLYHPAAAIYNQHLKETLLEDIKVLS